MRSMKLLAATAVLAALVAGPVMAQDAGGTMTPATDSGKTTTSTKHHTKKGKHHKKSTSSTAPATDSSTTK